MVAADERSCVVQVAGSVLSHALYSMTRDKGDVEGFVLGSRSEVLGRSRLSDTDETTRVERQVSIFVSGLVPFRGHGLRDDHGRVTVEHVAKCLDRCRTHISSSAGGTEGAARGEGSTVIGWFRCRRGVGSAGVSMFERAVHDALERALATDEPLLLGLFSVHNEAPSNFSTHAYEYVFLERPRAPHALVPEDVAGAVGADDTDLSLEEEEAKLASLCGPGTFRSVPVGVLNLDRSSSVGTRCRQASHARCFGWLRCCRCCGCCCGCCCCCWGGIGVALVATHFRC